MSRNFYVPADPAIALVLSKLIGNWTKEWNYFANVNNIFFNFKLLIGHNLAKSEKTLTSYISDGFAINQNSPPAKTATRFLVFIMPYSYKSNIVKTLEQIFHTGYILIEKVRTVHR